MEENDDEAESHAKNLLSVWIEIFSLYNCSFWSKTKYNLGVPLQ